MDMDAASVRQSLHRHFLKLPFEPVDPGSHADWDRAPPEYTSKTSAIPILPTKELNNDTSRCGTAKHSSIDTEDAYCTYSIHDDDDDDVYDLKAPPEYTSQASSVQVLPPEASETTLPIAAHPDTPSIQKMPIVCIASTTTNLAMPIPTTIPSPSPTRVEETTPLSLAPTHSPTH